ncbi:50S ribosomal protein L11 [Gammaproteobacteria bacterium]|nr:50S ribosomal protein L11 [Gammaproteobacteria bacterium]
MAKVDFKEVKLQIPAGKAAAGPPVGTALGPHGINMGEFVRKFNEETAPMLGDVVPVVVRIFKDRSFTFKVGIPPMSHLIKKVLSLKSGSSNPGKESAGVLTMDQVREIAERKMPELTATNLEAATKTVIGTARSMGIQIEGAEVN